VNLCVAHVLSESRNLTRFDEGTAHALCVPRQNDLGIGLALGGSDLSDNGVRKTINTFKLVWTKLPVTRAD